MKRTTFEVETVVEKDIILGFRCRTTVLWGLSQESPLLWACTRDLKQPHWKVCETRKECRQYLKELSKCK